MYSEGLGAHFSKCNIYLVSVFWAGFGSLAFGLLNAIVMNLLIKKICPKGHGLSSFTAALVLFHAVLIYALAHYPELSLSGDVALIIYAFFIRNYGILNFTEDGAKHINIAVIFFKELFENLAFVSLGLRAV